MRQILAESGPLLPHDSGLLVVLWPTSTPPTPASLSGHVDALLHRGLLRRVIVGTEPHLALPRPSRELEGYEHELSSPNSSNNPTTEWPNTDAGTKELAVPPSQPPSESTTLSTEQSDDKAFGLRLEIDTETERVLLYRVAVVLMAIGSLTILREWVLYAFHL